MSFILQNTKARKKIQNGAKILADTVKLTLGPKGRNVIIDREHADPLITNDGITIARNINLADSYENLGVVVIRQASEKTQKEVGDGTTSAIILANELLTRGNTQVALGSSPITIKAGMLHAAKIATDYVSTIAHPCQDNNKIFHIAANSCGNSNDANLIKDALEKVGTDGVVSIEEVNTLETTLTFSDGMELPLQLASPYFSDSPANFENTMANAKLLIVPSVIKSIKELLPILEYIAEVKQGLVIIAEDFSPEIIAALVLNRAKNGLNTIALKANRLGNNIEPILGDLAALTNSNMVSSESGHNLENVTTNDLGVCSKLTANMSKTIIIKSDSVNESLVNRQNQLRTQINVTTDEYQKTRLRERLASLTNGIATISVGGATAIERQEKKLRIDDAYAASLAAIREGIVEGGGVAYIRISQFLTQKTAKLTDELKTGAKILAESLFAILRQICINADASPELVIDRVTKSKLGFNASNGQYVDMMKANIIDPAAVIKNVIINATSVASTLLTSEAIITKTKS